jgi:hypothetical protein
MREPQDAFRWKTTHILKTSMVYGDSGVPSSADLPDHKLLIKKMSFATP